MRSFSRLSRRKLIAIPASLAVVAATLIAVPSAQADTPSVVSIETTSDVTDSNLMQAVLKPGFEAAYPQYSLSFQGNSTAKAITDGENGLFDAIIVHAASLENQFVSQGYSAEPYGRAIFWGDFVLAGPANDPAGVLSGPTAAHDIVTAFERIATAGAAGKATFVSRGNGPGTTVAEHAIWPLTSGVSVCGVTDTNGGGKSPSSSTATSADCGTSTGAPSWYEVTGAKQAANVQQADACTTPGYDVGCYVFTDRGTFQYLQSQNSIHNLGIQVRDNAATARGTNLALVNSFHAYAVNPAKFASGTIKNPAGAKAFLDYLTSPAAQAAVGKYLSASNDAPFIPSAAPKLTASAPPASVTRATPFTVTGTLSNVVPGTPALAGKTVNLLAAPAGTTAPPSVVATGTTDAAGNYSISYSPTANDTYSVSTPAASQIENATLNPVFGDLLQAQTTPVGTVNVVRTTAKVSISSIKVSKKYSSLITLKVVPKASGTSTIDLYGRNSNTKSSGLHVIKSVTVKAGVSTVKIRFQLSHGKHWKSLTWKLKAKYLGDQVTTTTSTKKTVVLR